MGSIDIKYFPLNSPKLDLKYINLNYIILYNFYRFQKLTQKKFGLLLCN